jgi:ring-1,2-phenylacetyl-CoA epoxidase subunit PaaE
MDVRAALEEKGVPKEKVHFELFTAPGMKKESAPKAEMKKKDFTGKMSHVEVILDGSRLQFDLPYDGASVLDTALSKGADLPFSCKGGVCCTCRAKLIEGEVEMDLNYSLEPDELERGFILTCQSHPRTERIVVDFDHQ